MEAGCLEGKGLGACGFEFLNNQAPIVRQLDWWHALWLSARAFVWMCSLWCHMPASDAVCQG